MYLNQHKYPRLAQYCPFIINHSPASCSTADFFFDCDKKTHRDNCEVKPTPGIGKVLLEAVAHPLQKHFTNENVGEDLVRVFERALEARPVAQLNILEGQRARRSHNHEHNEGFEPRVLDDAIGGLASVEHQQTGALVDVGVETGELVPQLVRPAVRWIHQIVVVDGALFGAALVGCRCRGGVFVLLAVVLGLFLLGRVRFRVGTVRVRAVGVVGGVTASVSFINILFRVSMSAFYLDIKV